MRTETTTRAYFSFEELSDEAREHAVGLARDRLADWLEADELSAVILYGVAEKLHAPGWDEYGVGDFPGIRGLTIDEWDLVRGNINADGTLTRENAPALPWPDDCGYARVGRTNAAWNGNAFDLWLLDEETGDACYPEWMADADRDDVTAFREAFEDALRYGLSLGAQELEWLTGEEYATEYLSLNHEGEVYDENGDW